MLARIKKGDKVIVITGKDKGKTGVVQKVLPKQNKATVSDINTVKKHVKPSMNNAGGIITFERPIDLSNLLHIDPKSDKPTRIGYRIENGVKVRFAKKSGEIIA